MHTLVRAIFKTTLSKAPRLPSLAGNGLPERMRTTAFAFLGLTAAAGLALVAIFAQLSFHVLSPAPLPEPPPQVGKVGASVSLSEGSREVAVGTARHAVASPPAARNRGGSSSQARGGHGALDGSAVPVSTSPPDVESTGSGPAETPAPSGTTATEATLPATSAEATPAPTEIAAGSPQGKPGKATAGNPGLGAKEEGDPKEEADPGKDEAAPPSGPSYEPTPVPPGKAKGWEKNGKKDS